MTVDFAPVRRGRPSNVSLSEQLNRARGVNTVLRMELRVERRESRLFAELVRAGVVDIGRALVRGRDDLIEQHANRLGYHAARRIQQSDQVAR